MQIKPLHKEDFVNMSLLSLLFSSCSAPIHMLPTRTLDQAHHCPRAAWDIPLPPNSRPSTLTRPTATETSLPHTHTHVNRHMYTHSPHHAHLNECTEGCGGRPRQQNPPCLTPLHLTEGTISTAVR